MLKAIRSLLLLVGLGLLALQLYFALRIIGMTWINPVSTSFERSAIYQIATTKPMRWRQEWRDYPRISANLKRAIISSEDGNFIDHDGVDWSAIERARNKNEKTEKSSTQSAPKLIKGKPAKPPKVVGGSTITQQLAKNLFLSGERTYLRKGQELVLVVLLETFLSKERIFELYLNHAEWGEGVFGAEAAAQHYFRKSAAQLDAYQGAFLAVMLPRPKFYEKRVTTSEYLRNQAAVVQGRMHMVEIP